MERKLKIHNPAFAMFDSLLKDVLRRYGENNIEGQIFPIDSSKTGIIFSSDGKPVQAFTVDANGKKREATIVKKKK